MTWKPFVLMKSVNSFVNKSKKLSSWRPPSPKSGRSSRWATALRKSTVWTRSWPGKLLDLPHGVKGIALNLEEDKVGAVLFGEYHAIKQGDLVKRTKRIMSVPVGKGFLGRVVNALGEPIDGRGPLPTTASIRWSALRRASSSASRSRSR
jgi:hypothetical protein